MTKKKSPPTALLETRPAIELDAELHHPSQGAPVGPPPRLYSRPLHDAIIQAIGMGNRPQIAAAMAGLPSNTFYRWMQLGREGHPHYWEFAEDVERAMASAEGKAVAVIAGGGDFALDSDNAKWWLERSRSDGYSKEAATKVNSMLEEYFKRLQENLPAVITADMVGRNMFDMVVSAGLGPSTTTAKPTFQLMSAANGDEEETEDE